MAGKKKQKKNVGNRGKRNPTSSDSGDKQKTAKEEGVKVGEIINLVDMKKDGVEILVVSNQGKNPTVNNNIESLQKIKEVDIKCEIENTVDEDFYSTKASADSTIGLDESGYQEANSSLLDKSSASSTGGKKTTVDLNRGFLASDNTTGPCYNKKNNGRNLAGNIGEVTSFSNRRDRKNPVQLLAQQSRRSGLDNVLDCNQSTTDMTIEDFVKSGVPHYIAVMKHPLENQWTFWYQKNDPGVNWEAQMKAIVDVSTVEDFWQVYHYLEPASNLQEGQDYSLFKKGIFPDWSDFQNMKGGRWIINMEKKEQYYEQPKQRKERLESMWLELLLVLIGEHTDEHAHQVNGVTINVKKRADRLSVWLRKANDLDGVMGVGRLVKGRLGIQTNNKMYFQCHEQASGAEKDRKRNSSQTSPQKIYI